jgi:glycosyltransferase involved in cell wall biosynthesis
MRILGLTSLYPNPLQPHRAPFNRHQFRLLGEHYPVRVIAPMSWTDELIARRRWAAPLPADRRVIHDGLPVEHPRYYFPPRVLRGFYGHCFRSSVRRAFERAVAEFRPDVIHAPFAYPDGWAAVQLGHEFGLPVVVQVHGSDVRLLDRHPARRPRTEEALRAADAVIAVSQDLADTVVRTGVDPDRVLLVYDGIDPELFRPGSKAAARARLGLDRDTRRLVFVGNFYPVKGADVLLRACHRLRQLGVAFEVDLVGQGPEGHTLRKLVRQLGLEGVVGFRGSMPQAELADWYRAADVFVLPSHSEGVPNVLLEAMACHTPYVATNVGGIPEIHVPEVGRLVPPNDPRALAATIAAELAAAPRDADAWPAPRLRTEAVAEAAEFLEAVVARRAGRTLVGA